MSSFGRSKWLFKQEMQAERKAANEVFCISFADCLRNNGLELEYPTMDKDKQGNTINVRGQDIVDKRTWEKFLLHDGKLSSDLISLVDDTEPLAEAYDSWLNNSYTSRYKALDIEGLKWRKEVVSLAVKYHIMDNKLNAHANGDDEAFVDEWAAIQCSLMRITRTAMSGFAKITKRVIDNPEEQQAYLDDFFGRLSKDYRSVAIPSSYHEELSRMVEMVTIPPQLSGNKKSSQEEGDIA